MQSHAPPVMESHPWMARARCERCGRSEHVVDGDGPSVCRVCIFAWGHYSTVILRGLIVHEVGGVQLRHAAHAYPTLGCPLCRTDQLRAAPSFDGWLHGRNA
jgi:ribosomal protein S14